MQPYEGISSRKLDARRIALSPVLLLHPSIKKLCTKIQAAKRIPNDVARRISALVKRIARLERSVLQLHKPKHRVRSNRSDPVMLITDKWRKEWQRFQCQIHLRSGCSVQAEPSRVVHIARDSISISDLIHHVVPAVDAHSTRCIHAPSKRRLLRTPIGQTRRQLSKDARHLNMSAFRFIAKLQCAVRSRSNRRSRRTIHRKTDIRARLLHRHRTAHASPDQKTVSGLRRTHAKARVRPLEVKRVRRGIRIQKVRRRLPHQNVVYLGIEMTQPRRRGTIAPEEIELHKHPRSSPTSYRSSKVCRNAALANARTEIVRARSLWNRYRRRNKRVRHAGRPRVKNKIAHDPPIDTQHGLRTWQNKKSWIRGLQRSVVETRFGLRVFREGLIVRSLLAHGGPLLFRRQRHRRWQRRQSSLDSSRLHRRGYRLHILHCVGKLVLSAHRIQLSLNLDHLASQLIHPGMQLTHRLVSRAPCILRHHPHSST